MLLALRDTACCFGILLSQLLGETGNFGLGKAREVGLGVRG